MNEYEKQADDFLRSTGAKITTEFKEFNSMGWDTDGAKRNIFKVTLANVNGREYIFDCGQSISKSVKNPNDMITGETIDFYHGLEFKGLDPSYLSYSAKIKIKDLKAAKNYRQFEALIDKRIVEKTHADFIKSNTSKYRQVVNIPRAYGGFGESWFDMIVTELMRQATDLAKKNWGELTPLDQPIHPTAYEILACLTKYDPGTFEDFCSEFGCDLDSRKAFKTYKSVRREWKNIELLFTDEQIEQLREIN